MNRAATRNMGRHGALWRFAPPVARQATLVAIGGRDESRPYMAEGRRDGVAGEQCPARTLCQPFPHSRRG